MIQNGKRSGQTKKKVNLKNNLKEDVTMLSLNKKDIEKMISYFSSDKHFDVTQSKEKARLVKEFLSFKRLYENNELAGDAYGLAKKYVDYAEKWLGKNSDYAEAYKQYYEHTGQKVKVL